MNAKLTKLKQVLDETIRLSNEQRPSYMAGGVQLVSVLKEMFAVLEEQDGRIRQLEERKEE